MNSFLHKFNDPWFAIPSAILGISLIVSAGVMARTWYAVRALDNTFTVTGSAKESAVADSAHWTLNVERGASEGSQSEAYDAVARDASAVVSYLTKHGVPETDITRSPISADIDYSVSQQSGVRRFIVRQSVTVTSKDVNLIEKLSSSIADLARTGVYISAMPPEYYVSTLPEARVRLIGKAVEDARTRAVEIAKSSKSSVGALKSASSGVVQVLSPGSAAVDDYGAYDTSSIKKEIMVTVRATFLVK